MSEGAAQSTPLNSSVIIFDEATLDRAPAMVDRAAALGNRRVMVVVTMHCRLTPELRVTEYGLVADRSLMWRVPNHPQNFLPVNEERRRELTDRLAAVFRRAVAHGMDLAILPHIDAYGDIYDWRNRFDFDPLEKHQGESYASAVIKPIVDALNRSITPTTGVQFSLSGEMGRSFFTHPERYEKLAATIREHVKSEKLEVGVSLNHSDVADGIAPNAKQRESLQRMFGGFDFIGFSHYRPFTGPPRVEHFAEACDVFVDALESKGIQLPAATPLHFSEVAIGGGRGEAPSPAAASREPWEGTGDHHRNPWRTAEMQTLRRAYHDRLLDFLRTQPAKRRVEAAYLWSEGSWDPQGIDGRRFVDEEVVEAIRRHNAAANAGTN